MARWSKQIGNILQLSSSQTTDAQFMESFNKIRNYLPKTEQEKEEFEEFSLVTSSMALLIHIAKADNVLKGEEHERIISDLIFQLEQRPYEYGDEIIRIICMVYQNNPDKRYYLLRLCYYVALSDFDYDKAEQEAIMDIATKLYVSTEEMQKVEQEVRDEIINLK